MASLGELDRRSRAGARLRAPDAAAAGGLARASRNAGRFWSVQRGDARRNRRCVARTQRAVHALGARHLRRRQRERGFVDVVVRYAEHRWRLMLLDTYGLVYRAFFALPGLTTSKGMPINAVYGFTMMLNKLIADEKPTHILAAFDKGMPADRVCALCRIQGAAARDARRAARPVRAGAPRPRNVSAFRSSRSKGKRPTTSSQRSRVKPKRPASRRSSSPAISISCRSSTSARRCLTTRRGITELGRYDPAAVRERFGLEPAQLPDYRGLKGDPSDNLPGIPGVGEKTASQAVAGGRLARRARRGSGARRQSETRRSLIEQYGQQACLCRAVSVVRRDLPLARRLGEQPLSRAARARPLSTLQRARVQDAAREAEAAGRSAALRERARS